MKVGELFVQLGVQADTPVVRAFSNEIESLPLKIAGTVAALAGMDYAFFDIAQRAFSTATSFQSFTSMTGLNAQALQKWQIVAEQANVGADAVKGSIIGLQNAMVRARLGQGLAPGFMWLGISPYQDPIAAMEKIRRAIKGFRPELAATLIESMGISREMMNIFALSDEQFARFVNNARGLTKEQEDVLVKQKQIIVSFGQKWRDVVFGVVANFSEASMKSSQFRGVLLAVGVAVLAITAYFNAMAAAIAAVSIAVGALVNDFARFYNGKDSQLGKIVDKFKDFGEQLSTAGGISAMVQKGVLFPATSALGGFGLPGVPSVAGALANNFNIYVTGSAEASASAIVDLVMDRIGGLIRDSINNHNNGGHR